LFFAQIPTRILFCFVVCFCERELRHLTLECQQPVATGDLRLLANLLYLLAAGRWGYAL
jgi:hypothetical protein